MISRSNIQNTEIFNIQQFKIWKTWNQAIQAYLFLLHTDYYLTLRNAKEKRTGEKATFQSANPPKFPAMGFYAYY